MSIDCSSFTCLQLEIYLKMMPKSKNALKFRFSLFLFLLIVSNELNKFFQVPKILEIIFQPEYLLSRVKTRRSLQKTFEVLKYLPKVHLMLSSLWHQVARQNWLNKNKTRLAENFQQPSPPPPHTHTPLPSPHLLLLLGFRFD